MLKKSNRNPAAFLFFSLSIVPRIRHTVPAVFSLGTIYAGNVPFIPLLTVIRIRIIIPVKVALIVLLADTVRSLPVISGSAIITVPVILILVTVIVRAV